MQDGTGIGARLYTGQSGVSSSFLLIQGRGLNIRLSWQNNAWIGGLIASVDSDGKGFSQQFGYFEMKAKFRAKAPGTWPAFWMMPKPGVVGGDHIVEAYGHDTTHIVITLHDWVHNNIPAHFYPHLGDLTDVYHAYGLPWTEQTIFDDAKSFRRRQPDVLKQPYYLLVDFGVGGGWPTDRTPNPSDMQVQYVNQYTALPSPPRPM
jgi:beta-glucanase (GH16 family)